jgi:hypothetical protein
MIEDEKTKKKGFLEGVVGVYVILVGVGVPIIVRDYYFDILIVKYYYYLFCSICLIVLFAIYSFTSGRKKILLYANRNSYKQIFRRFGLTDYFALSYLGIAVISTVTSNYIYESFWGNEGRYTGLFLIIFYVSSYFIVSKFLKFKNLYVDVILITGIIVCIFGITDYFQLDLFHFKVSMVEKQKNIFTSTIGNINTYTAYVGLILAISTVLFTTCINLRYRVFYYICMIIGFFAIIMGASDNAYLSLAALFAFMPLYLFDNKRGLRNYLIVVATFLSSVKCVGWINLFFESQVIGIDSVFNYIVEFKGLLIVIVSLWIIIFFWYLLDNKRNNKNIYYGNKLRFLWLGCIVLIIVLFVLVLYDANVQGHDARYGKLENYLVFNDEWGTHRGYIWRNAIECFNNLSLWKKIFGYGPETFGILLLRKTANNPYNEVFDSAHNEYLHCLITVGIAGLIAYVLFVLSFIKDNLKKHSNPYIIAIVFGIICYSVQAFVNLNLPIVTPIFWLLLGIGKAKSNVISLEKTL